MANEKKSVLGRGIAALMGDGEEGVASGNAPRLVPIENLIPNPYQPRRVFDTQTMDELVDSIKEKGMLQPLLVRPFDADDGYQIVAGERRWRAAQRAGLHQVPVVVRDMSDSEALELGLIENVQRDDLSAVEEAAGYRRLIDDFGHTQEQVARLVAKSRSHIANLLRLMTLPESVLDMVATGQLSMGHARTIVGSKDPATMAKMIISKGMSVRAAEKLTRGIKGGSKRKNKQPSKDTNTLALERDISIRLGLSVEIEHKGDQGGELIVKYKSLEQLDMVCGKLRAE
jgi:ParB family transcriptional regulator, chromosome partitioning protein